MLDGRFVATGGCLCARVRFGLREKLPPLGFCHCSQCRRTSGTGSNAVLSVRQDRFEWLSGQDNLRRYSTPTVGARSSALTAAARCRTPRHKVTECLFQRAPSMAIHHWT